MNIDDFQFDSAKGVLTLQFADKYRVKLTEASLVKGYVVFLLVDGCIRCFCVQSKRLGKYPKQWLETLQFRFKISGLSHYVLDAGTYTSGVHAIYRFMTIPSALQSILAVDGFRLTFKATTDQLERFPKRDELSPLEPILSKWGVPDAHTGLLEKWLLDCWGQQTLKDVLGTSTDPEYIQSLKRTKQWLDDKARQKGIA